METKNTGNSRCFTRRHLKPTQYLLWDYAKAISQKTGVFRLNGPRVAEELVLNRKTVDTNVKKLVEKGWFVKVKEYGRKPDGTFEGRQFEVLSHGDWIVRHPGKCPLLQPIDHAQFSTMDHAQKLGMDHAQKRSFTMPKNWAI
jgi:hypothetical protein